MKSILITGSSGLVGSEAVVYFERRGWLVYGVDNNLRRSFFGADGDTNWNLERLRRQCENFRHCDLDIRDRERMFDLVKEIRPAIILHFAAQPSHDLARDRPFDDFEVNAVGTLNLLEAARSFCRDSPFVFMSTNKVYGDAPNELPLVELETRWEYARPEDWEGINENCRIDRSMHSLFGVSKAAADLMVQEYGRYFDMPTVCFRGGCLTGPNHSSAEAHGFLAYVARCFRENRKYRIYGYKGKQVRDNIHSYDVCTAIDSFCKNPRIAAVYNLGGGRENSVSVLEAVDRLGELFGTTIETEYIDTNRAGDHICYISDLSSFKRDYPDWSIKISLNEIFEQLRGKKLQSGAA